MQVCGISSLEARKGGHGAPFRKVRLSWLAFLLCTAGYAAPTVADSLLYLKDSRFTVPIELDPGVTSQVSEIRLFVSNDRGRSWKHLRTVKPTLKAFEFQSQGDGEFWFAVASVDLKGRVQPEIHALAPDVKVVIDTKAPVIEIAPLSGRPGKVGVTWKVTDANLDVRSMKLLIRGEQDTAWRELPVLRQADGQTDWPSARDEAYAARLIVSDHAGNENSAQIDVPPAELPAQADWGGGRAHLPTSPIMPSAEMEPATSGLSPRSLPPRHVAAIIESQKAGSHPASEFAPIRSNTKTASSAWEQQSIPPHDATRPVFTPIPSNELPQLMRTVPTPAPLTQSRAPIAATTSPIAQTSAFSSPSETTDKIPLVGSRSFAMHYQLRNVGPAGVSKVEIYLTQDNGQTWQRFAEDADRTPPFEVTLPKDGRYGLSVVVTNAAGWHRPPKAGDRPQLFLEIDTTAPEAELYEPAPDPAGGNALVISWAARDARLGERPVSLFYAESREGARKPIQTGLSASGEHRWEIPTGTHHKVYLFLVAEDMSGNTSMAVTPQPVLIDFSRPEAVITTGDIALLPGASTTR